MAYDINIFKKNIEKWYKLLISHLKKGNEFLNHHYRTIEDIISFLDVSTAHLTIAPFTLENQYFILVDESKKQAYRCYLKNKRVDELYIEDEGNNKSKIIYTGYALNSEGNRLSYLLLTSPNPKLYLGDAKYLSLKYFSKDMPCFKYVVIYGEEKYRVNALHHSNRGIAFFLEKLPLLNHREYLSSVLTDKKSLIKMINLEGIGKMAYYNEATAFSKLTFAWLLMPLFNPKNPSEDSKLLLGSYSYYSLRGISNLKEKILQPLINHPSIYHALYNLNSKRNVPLKELHLYLYSYLLKENSKEYKSIYTNLVKSVYVSGSIYYDGERFYVLPNILLRGHALVSPFKGHYEYKPYLSIFAIKI